MKYKEISIVWVEDLDRWSFILKTDNFLTLGLIDELIYQDDQDDVILKTAAKWIKKISPNSTGYRITLSRPRNGKGQKLKTLLNIFR